RLLFVGGVVEEVAEADVGMDRDVRRRPHEAGISEFFRHHRVHAEIGAQAAMLLVHGRAQETGLPELRPERAVDDAGLFPAGEMRGDLLRDEAAQARAQIGMGGVVDATVGQHRVPPRTAMALHVNSQEYHTLVYFFYKTDRRALVPSSSPS